MRQLSFSFLQAGQHIVKGAPNLEDTTSRLNSEPVSMRKVDPTKNMARFYSLEVERDLLGRVVLVRRWGRIGAAGKVRLDEQAG
ncbi:WGR domain-containing protein [Microvirga sp. P5_D2]